jgi:hypothetical protein
MAPNFLHLRGRPEEALALVQEWIGDGKPHYEADPEVERNGWVTLSIDLSFLPTDRWLALGERVDLLYEFYSTAVHVGEIVCIRSQQLARHLLIDEKEPDSNMDEGTLRAERDGRFETWGDIWGFVDDGRWTQEVAPALELLAGSEAFNKHLMQPMKADGVLKEAERGSPVDQVVLARSLLSGVDYDGNAIPVDPERAKHLLEEAVRSALPSALHLLGTMLEEGLAGAPNIERAVRLYEKVADKRAYLPSIQSCVRLARIHSKVGTERCSPEEAKRRYQAVLEIAEKYGIEAEASAEIQEAKSYLGLAR